MFAIEIAEKTQRELKETEESFNKRLDEQAKIQTDKFEKELRQRDEAAAQSNKDMQAKIEHFIKADTFKAELNIIESAVTKSNEKAETDKTELNSKIDTINNDIITKLENKEQEH